jgi:DNA-directed RNA polymerase specialized sigma24 family protein
VSDRPPFAEFAARQHGDLLRLAVLLEDERADADDLVRGVLVTVRARWRRLGRGDPARQARRLLVRRVLARRPSGGAGGSGWVDDPGDGWDVGRHDDLRRALSALPLPTRAAVVLSFWAGLPDREVGDLVRSPEDTVRGEVVAGLAPLRAALAPVAAPWHLGARPADDGELRAELTALADDEVEAADAAGAAAAAEQEVTARRRRRWPVAVAVAAAVTVAAVPALTGEDPAPTRAAEPRERSQLPPPPPPAADISGLPTRGSLAGDSAFLDGLLQQPWENELTGDYPMDVATAEDSRRVLYAADVPAGRWALVVGRPEAVDPLQEGIGGPYISDDLYMAWFAGPRGAAPDDMELVTFPYGIAPGVTPALLDPPSGTLVVVGAPGDQVEVSERVEVAADGTDSRTWTPVATADGIAETDIDPVDLPWTWAVSYRITRDGGTVHGTPDGLMSTPPQEEIPDLGIDYAGGPPDPAGRRAAEWAAFISLSALGAPTDDTDITARVVSPVPGGEGSVALVTITLPSGAFLVSAQWAWDIRDDYPGAADCGLDVRPAEPPPGERLLVAACEMFDPLEGRPLGKVLVASVPPGVAAVRLYRGDGGFLEEHEVDGDSLVLPMPEGTRRVEAVTADGVALGRSELLGHWQPTTD